MKNLLLCFLLMPCITMGMDKESRTSAYGAIKVEAETIRAKARFFDYITNPWIPTGIFLSSVTYEGIKSWRNDSLPTFSGVCEEIQNAPRAVMVGSLFLASCMIYNYYKPLVSSAYAYFRGGSLSDEKKTKHS